LYIFLLIFLSFSFTSHVFYSAALPLPAESGSSEVDFIFPSSLLIRSVPAYSVLTIVSSPKVPPTNPESGLL
jgi:hypothetical protein